MSSKVVISDIAEIIMGQSPKKKDVNEVGDGYPLLNGPTEFTERYPEPVQFTTDGRRFSDFGDILFCVRGSTTGRMNYADQPYAIGRGIAAIRGKDGYPTPFVRAVIENNLDRLLAAATGSTFPNVSKSLLNEFDVDVISPDEAQSVNEILVSLESKIHLNQQTNETLEAMAQAIFKSWFVDFDPVRAKMEAKSAGRDPNRAAMAAISGVNLDHGWNEIEAALEQKLSRMSDDQRTQLLQTAELFPDELVESEIGVVPKGWGESKLEDYITLSYGKSLRKSDRKDGKVPVYGSGGLTGSHNESLIDGPGIIIGRKGTVGSIYWEDKDYWPIDTVFYVEPKNGVDLSFYYYLLNTLGLDDMNTDAAVPGLNRNNAYRLKIPSFPDDLMNHFAEFTSDIHKTMNAKIEERRTLENLRDTLLPKLISGEVGV